MNNYTCFTTTVSTHDKCIHANGAYGVVTFGIFYKRIFYCEDCRNFIDMKKLKEDRS